MKKRRFLLTALIIILGLCLLYACHNTPPMPPNGDETEYEPDRTVTATKLVVYEGPNNMQPSERVDVKAEGEELFVYSTRVNHRRIFGWEQVSTTSDVVIFAFEGKIKIEVTVKSGGEISNAVIRPLAWGIVPAVQGSKITFELEYPSNYVLEYEDSSTGRPAYENALHIFANEIEENPITAETADENTVYIGPGVYMASAIPVRSNTTVYLAGGAYVYGQILAANVSNVTIRGHGILAGDLFNRTTDAEKTLPIEFQNSENITIEDITILDPAGWAITLYHCKNVNINDIKIITARANGDGISVQSCENVRVFGGFVRTWDDSLVVKNVNRGNTKNITFDNVVVWTDLAQSCEVGYETNGAIMDGITFKNITIVHNFHKAAMSIHNCDDAVISNVKFMDITLEDGQMLGDNRMDGENDFLIDLTVAYNIQWSSSGAQRGKIKDVTFSNIKVLSLADTVISRMTGESAGSGIENINIYNIEIEGKKVTSLQELDIAKNEFVKNVNLYDTAPVTGARKIRKYNLELANDDVQKTIIPAKAQQGIEVPDFAVLNIEPSYLGIKVSGISSVEATHGYGTKVTSAVHDDGSGPWEKQGSEASKLIDNDKATCWESKDWQGIDEELAALSFTFSQPQNIGTIRIFGEQLGSLHYVYRIAVFKKNETEGGKPWLSLQSGKNYAITPVSGNFCDIKIAAQEYTGLQLRLFRQEGIAYPSVLKLSEIEFYPTSLTTNKPIIDASEHEDVYDVNKIVDGDNYSYYESKKGVFPAYFIVDMQGVYNIKYINMHLPPIGTWPQRIQEIEIQASVDGVNYVTIVSKKAYTFNIENGNMVALVLDNPVSARYVKFIYSSNDSGYGAQISELYIYQE